MIFFEANFIGDAEGFSRTRSAFPREGWVCAHGENGSCGDLLIRSKNRSNDITGAKLAFVDRAGEIAGVPRKLFVAFPFSPGMLVWSARLEILSNFHPQSIKKGTAMKAIPLEGINIPTW